MDLLDNFPEFLRKHTIPQVQQIKIPYQGTALRLSPCKNYILYSTRCGRVVILNKTTHEVFADLKVSDASLWNLSISPDNSFILACGVDMEIKHILFPSLQVLPPFLGHTSEINHAVINRNSTEVYSGSDDGTVRRWVVTTHQTVVLYSHSRIIYALDLAVDDTLLASGDSTGCVKVYDLRESRVRLEVIVGFSVWCLKITARLNYIVIGDSKGTVRVFSIEGGLVAESLRHSERLRCIDSDKNERLFVSTGNDHLVKLWNIYENCEEITFDYHTDWVKSAVIDEEERTITTTSDDNLISIIKIPDTRRNKIFAGKDVRSIEVFEETGHLYALSIKGISVHDMLAFEVIDWFDFEKNEVTEVLSFHKSGKLMVLVCNYEIVTVNVIDFQIKRVKFRVAQNLYSVGEKMLVSYIKPKLILLDILNLESSSMAYENVISLVYVYRSAVFIAKNCILQEFYSKWQEKFTSRITKIHQIDRELLIVFADRATVFSYRKKIATITAKEVPIKILSSHNRIYSVYEKNIEILSKLTFERIHIIRNIDSSVITMCSKGLIVRDCDGVTVKLIESNYRDKYNLNLEKKMENIRAIMGGNALKYLQGHQFLLEHDQVNILHVLAYYGDFKSFKKLLLDQTSYIPMFDIYSPLHVALYQHKYQVINKILKYFHAKMMYSVEDCLTDLSYLQSPYLNNVYKQLSKNALTGKHNILNQVHYESKYYLKCTNRILKQIKKVPYFLSLMYVDNQKVFSSRFVLYIISTEKEKTKWIIYIENLICFIALLSLYLFYDSWLLSFMQVILNTPVLCLSLCRISFQLRHSAFLSDNLFDVLRWLLSATLFTISFFNYPGIKACTYLLLLVLQTVRQFELLTYFSYFSFLTTLLKCLLTQYLGVLLVELYLILSIIILMPWLDEEALATYTIILFLFLNAIAVITLAEGLISQKPSNIIATSKSLLKHFIQVYSLPSFIFPHFKYHYDPSMVASLKFSKLSPKKRLKLIESSVNSLKANLNLSSQLGDLKSTSNELILHLESQLQALLDLIN